MPSFVIWVSFSSFPCPIAHARTYNTVSNRCVVDGLPDLAEKAYFFPLTQHHAIWGDWLCLALVVFCMFCMPNLLKNSAYSVNAMNHIC